MNARHSALRVLAPLAALGVMLSGGLAWGQMASDTLFVATQNNVPDNPAVLAFGMPNRATYSSANVTGTDWDTLLNVKTGDTKSTEQNAGARWAKGRLGLAVQADTSSLHDTLGLSDWNKDSTQAGLSIKLAEWLSFGYSAYGASQKVTSTGYVANIGKDGNATGLVFKVGPNWSLSYVSLTQNQSFSSTLTPKYSMTREGTGYGLSYAKKGGTGFRAEISHHDYANWYQNAMPQLLSAETVDDLALEVMFRDVTLGGYWTTTVIDPSKTTNTQRFQMGTSLQKGWVATLFYSYHQYSDKAGSIQVKKGSSETSGFTVGYAF